MDEAPAQLEKLDPRQARIVEMKFWAGLSNDEIAQTFDLSIRTIIREWQAAQAWLYQDLKPAVQRAASNDADCRK